MTSVELAAYRLFGYEKELARRELDSLTRSVEGSSLIEDAVRDRSTYFESVNDVPTVQALSESLHHAGRGSRPTRQATRYLVHGLHEYKGKFNPQTCRALINVVDPNATALLDPFCGSGTTLVEGLRLGLSVAGIDQNPLAAWITQVKVDTLRLNESHQLVERFDRLVERLLVRVQAAQESGRGPESPHSDEDQAYLRHWFPAEVLAALGAGLAVCDEYTDPVADVLRLCISNIVRNVSWQLPEDLRVRRRPASWTPPRVADLVSESLRRARFALTEVAHAPGVSGSAAVHQGSSRDAAVVERAWPKGRRLVVTSPPYATALPYIDTDRLSMVLLGLADAYQIRHLEQQLTGSREWRTAEAERWGDARRANLSELPSGILNLLDRIEDGNRETHAGFRRRAVPTLLYRYFTHMGETLDALRSFMRPGEMVVMVVGSNRTGGPSGPVEIRTPELLGLLSGSRGFEHVESIPLETWARYGMHSRNAVSSEEVVVMEAR